VQVTLSPLREFKDQVVAINSVYLVNILLQVCSVIFNGGSEMPVLVSPCQISQICFEFVTLKYSTCLKS
jgi:hypothetical protein